MARFRRYRKYTRRNRTKWASNIQEIVNNTINASGEFSAAVTLCSNPVQTNTFVSQTYTVKNIECSLELETASSSFALESLAYYVMFVPQGFGSGSPLQLPNDYNIQHPEYVMAYRFVGSPSSEAENNITTGPYRYPLRIKTRLARKLNTGDNIVLFIKGTKSGTGSETLLVNGLVRWWTKAN